MPIEGVAQAVAWLRSLCTWRPPALLVALGSFGGTPGSKEPAWVWGLVVGGGSFSLRFTIVKHGRALIW